MYMYMFKKALNLTVFYLGVPYFEALYLKTLIK